MGSGLVGSSANGLSQALKCMILGSQVVEREVFINFMVHNKMHMRIVEFPNCGIASHPMSITISHISYSIFHILGSLGKSLVPGVIMERA